MKVLFFSQDGEYVEQLVLALRLRWPDLKPLIVSQGGVGIQVVEQEEPDLVMLCENLPDMTMWQAIREVRRFSDIPIILAVECHNDMDVVKAIEEFKGGKVEYRTDRFANIHIPIGKASFTEEALLANLRAVVGELERVRPASAKGRYIKKVVVSTTMGPGVQLDPARLATADA